MPITVIINTQWIVFQMYICFLCAGMNVGLHSFLGESARSMLEIIFPTADKKILTFDQTKEIIVLEESEGNEMTIEMFFQYLHYLADYKKGVYRILHNSV